MSKAGSAVKQVLFYLFLLLYILLLAEALLFKQVSLPALFDADRTMIRSLNLVPFKTILEYTDFNIWIALMNVAGNVVLFLPMGLYLQIFKRDKRILPSLAIVCAASICVEALQYALAIGSADIDDMILNTAGGLCGVFLYRLLYRLGKDEEKTKTAVPLLFCIVSAVALAGYLILVYGFGYRIRIF